MLIPSLVPVTVGVLILIPLLLPILGIEFLKGLAPSILFSMFLLTFIKLISLLRLSVRELVEQASSVCSMVTCFLQLISQQCHFVTWLTLSHHNSVIPTWQHIQDVKCNRKTTISTLQPVVQPAKTRMSHYVSIRLHTIITIN